VLPQTVETKLIGQSAAVRAIEAEVSLAARSDAKVLITGETGVGKEVVARLIHHRSARASAQVVTINCAGLPDSLLESELFGHVRGSFTGAYRDKLGLVESAPNGTLFMDEVGEMSPRMQVVLLRFLETGEIQAVGADRPRARVNVRLIAATNRDLESQIESGAFREDLYFRLNVISILIPPLRDRIEDVPLLAAHFLDLYRLQHRRPASEISSEAMGVLLGYRWPGNVRELKNVIERTVLKAPGSLVRREDLPADIVRAAKGAPSTLTADGTPHQTQRAHQAVELLGVMASRRESFWSLVYPQFMARDLTRGELRALVQLGLEQTNGSYRALVELFNMPATDYKRFLGFLRKHDCHLPFQPFRAAPRFSIGTAEPGTPHRPS
jgi:transcriptional regulator with GAF, ATPase, and Fis domain